MNKLIFNILLILFTPTILYAQSCETNQTINEFGTEVSYEEDKCVFFPEVRVTYKGIADMVKRSKLIFPQLKQGGIWPEDGGNFGNILSKRL